MIETKIARRMGEKRSYREEAKKMLVKEEKEAVMWVDKYSSFVFWPCGVYANVCVCVCALCVCVFVWRPPHPLTAKTSSSTLTSLRRLEVTPSLAEHHGTGEP